MYDQRKHLSKEEIMEQLTPLLEKYGYVEYADKICVMIRFPMEDGTNLDLGLLELCKLILLLRGSKSHGKEIVIKGLIPLAITSSFLLGELERSANVLLFEDWGLYDNLNIEKAEQPNGRTEWNNPLSDDELRQVIKSKSLERKRVILTNAAYRGMVFSRWNLKLCSDGIFFASINKKHNGKAIGVSNEYAFLYDCYHVIFKRADDQVDTKGKYDFVKACLKSFNKAEANGWSIFDIFRT